MITMTGALSLNKFKSLDRDGVGTLASSLCVAHCVLTPVILLSLPFAGLAILGSEVVDRSLALLAIAVAIIAFVPGYHMHGSKKLVALVSAGIACLLFAAFGAEAIWGETGDTVFTMLGGSIIVASHLLNRSFCKACPTCEVKCCAADS